MEVYFVAIGSGWRTVPNFLKGVSDSLGISGRLGDRFLRVSGQSWLRVFCIALFPVWSRRHGSELPEIDPMNLDALDTYLMSDHAPKGGCEDCFCTSRRGPIERRVPSTTSRCRETVLP